MCTRTQSKFRPHQSLHTSHNSQRATSPDLSPIPAGAAPSPGRTTPGILPAGMPRSRDEPAAVRVYTVCDESKYHSPALTQHLLLRSTAANPILLPPHSPRTPNQLQVPHRPERAFSRVRRRARYPVLVVRAAGRVSHQRPENSLILHANVLCSVPSEFRSHHFYIPS